MLTKLWTDGSRDSRIGRRLLLTTTLPIVTVGVLLLAAGVYGASRVHQLHKRGSEILSVNVSSIRAAEDLEISIREIRYRLKQFLLSGDGEHLDKIAGRHQRVGRYLHEAERLATTKREQHLIDQMKEGYHRFSTDFDQIRRQPPSQVSSQFVEELADEVLPNRFLIYAQQYVALNEDQVTKENERNQTSANQLVFGLLLLGTCGGVTGLLAGYGIARGINRTLVQLSFPIRDVAGKLNEVVGPVTVSADPGFDDLEMILQNVSERVATVVKRLQQSQREALRAEQLAAVGQLAAGMAHELRNPLTSMKVIVQLAADLNRLETRDLDVLKEEIGRLEQSLQTFLDFARPPQMEKQKTELRNLVEQTVTLVARRAERQGIRFKYQPPSEPAIVDADVAQIRQVVLNLLLNALDAVPKGGLVRLEVSCDVPEGEGETSSLPGGAAPRDRWASIRVIDTGCGLPAELGQRIFEPFVSTKETGVGLGLSICNRILEEHGGEVVANDRPEGGAVFTVRLPLYSFDETPRARDVIPPRTVDVSLAVT